MALDARVPAGADPASRRPGTEPQGAESAGAAPAQPRDYFRQKVWLTWAVLCALLGAGFYGLHLDFGYVGQKLPYLLGLRLSPDGFIQGAVLTVFVTGCSMLCALAVAFLTALGRLSARVDLLLETPLGAVALSEYASGKRVVLLRTHSGAHLVTDPWHASWAAEDAG